MSRVEVIGDCTLYLGDCREIAESITGIDAVVSDPPYGIDFVCTHKVGKYLPRFGGVKIYGDDSPFDPSWLLRWPVVLWGANHFARHLTGGGRWLVWDKRPTATTSISFSDVEIAWVSGARSADRIYRQQWAGFRKSGEAHGRPRVHPTQKPVELMAWCLGFVPDARMILDPYMGSGSTGVACVKMDRAFTGIEIDQGYFDTACRRIEEAVRQPRLALATPAPVPAQEALI